MEHSIVEHYQTAAKVHALCRKRAEEFIQPGMKLLDIAEEIEPLMKKNGCGIAFPLNLSLNELAAHYTPSEEDDTRVEKGDVLKVDIGVHQKGYIVDAAITLDFSKKNEVKNLLEATKEALEEGFTQVKEGAFVSDIGKAIQKKLKERKVDPIHNLSGHGVDQYHAHCSPTIPNIETGESTVLEDNHAYALEPFASIQGTGRISEGSRVDIFEVNEKTNTVRNPIARKLYDFCAETYDGLPFAERWIARDMKITSFQRKIALRELVKFGALTPHPVLQEKKGAIVSQFETTILINDKKVLRLV
ncbi:MAG: type II methionyl aminopeptidase [Candidatus Diapherotrites archaeon]